MTERTDLFQPATLPAQGASDASLMGRAICPGSAAGPEDRRILVNPSGSQALFPSITDYNAMSNSGQYLDIDQALWSRIVAARGDFQYDGRNAQGNPVFLHQSICREANPVSGTGADARYRVFARTPPEIYNPPTQAYPGVSFTFHPREIQLLVQGLPKADGSGTLMSPLLPLEYATDLRNPHGLYIQPTMELDRVRAIEAAIRDPQSPIAEDRREAMATAFHSAFGNQFGTQGFQQRSEVTQGRMGDRMDRMERNNYVLQGLMMYLMARQMNLTSRIDSLVGNVLQAAARTPGYLIQRNWTGLTADWRAIFRSRSPILVDDTQRMRSLNVPLSELGRQILEGFDRGQLPHGIVSGPSGGGKGFGIDGAVSAIVRGDPSVTLPEVFQGQDVRYVRISASNLIREAGSWLNGGESKFFQTINGLGEKQITIVHLTEADLFSKAGMGPGNQPLNLLEKIYEVLERQGGRYGNLYFILDSTRWGTIEMAAPDILRRTFFAELRPPLPQELRAALDAAVRARQADGTNAVQQQRYTRFSLTSGALDAVTALGTFERGAPPSSYLAVMDAVVAEVARANRNSTTTGNVQITETEVIRYVARSTNRPVPEVEAEMRTVIGGGISNNSRIQSDIMRAFYTAYGTPKNGFFNPLRPNPNPVMDAAGNPLPRGAYLTAAEAFGTGAPNRTPPSVPPAPGPNPAAPQPARQPAPATVRTGWEEVLTHRVNDRAVYESLTRVDSRLAEFYRERISTLANPVTTMSDLIARVSLVNPNALTGALEVATREGLSISQMSERALFELITLSAERARPEIVRDIDATRRAQFARTFETEVRTRRGLEAREARPAETARREEDARRRRAPRSR